VFDNAGWSKEYSSKQMNAGRVLKDIAPQYGLPRERVLGRSNREAVKMAAYRLS